MRSSTTTIRCRCSIGSVPATATRSASGYRQRDPGIIAIDFRRPLGASPPSGFRDDMPRTPSIIPIRPPGGRRRCGPDREVVIELYEKQPRSTPRARLVLPAGAGRWMWLAQLVFTACPGCNGTDGRPCCFNPRSAASRSSACCCNRRFHLSRRAAGQISALALFFFEPRWPGGCGAATPAHKRSTPRFSCGWNARVGGDRLAGYGDAGAWTANKLARKGSKQALWILISLVTGFTFVGYFRRSALASGPWRCPSRPGNGSGSCSHGFATYGNAGYLREQMLQVHLPVRSTSRAR